MREPEILVYGVSTLSLRIKINPKKMGCDALHPQYHLLRVAQSEGSAYSQFEFKFDSRRGCQPVIVKTCIEGGRINVPLVDPSVCFAT